MKIFDPKLTGSIEIQNTITGDVTLSGNLIVDGNLGGAVTASATASYVDFDNIDSKPTLLSGSAQIASDISGSFTSLSSSVASELLKNTTDTLTGDLTVTGTITAQDLHVQEVTSSIVYSSGSNIFGNQSTDTQELKGSTQIISNKGSESQEYNSFNVADDSDTTKGIRLAYDTGSDAGVIAASDLGTGWKDILINPIGGDVGIGTTSPTAKVSIKSSGASGIVLETDSSNSANSGRIFFKNNSTGNAIMTESGILTFRTGAIPRSTSGTKRLSVESSGIVTIGDGSTSGTLQFENDIKTRKVVLYLGANNDNEFYGFGVENSTLVYSVYTASDDHVFFSGYSGGRNELMRIGGDGKVGIGTSSPNSWSILDINGQISSRSNISLYSGQGIKFNQYYNSATVTDKAISTGYVSDIIFNTSTGILSFRGSSSSITAGADTSVSNNLNINSSGYVGIGTLSSASPLHINNTSTPQLIIQNVDGGANAERIGIELDSGDIFRIKSLNDNNTVRTNNIITGNILTGKVGIGSATPEEKLTIDGTSSGAYLRISNAASGDISSGIMIYNGSNLDTQIYTNPTFGNTTFLTREALAIRAGGSQRMAILSNGNVGIGTTSPTQKLEVYDGAIQAGTAAATAASTTLIQRYNSGQILGNISTGHSGGSIQINWGVQPKTSVRDGWVSSHDNFSSYKNSYQIGDSGEFEWYTSTAQGQVTVGSDVAMSKLMVLTYDGKLGIGSTTPNAPLTVQGSTIAVGTGYNFEILANNDGNWGFQVQRTDGQDDYNTRMKFYPVTSSTRKLGFWNASANDWMGYFDGSTSSDNRFIINGGDVGIGTTAPKTKLQVNGPIGMKNAAAGDPINARLVKAGSTSVAFTIKVGAVGAWRAGHAFLKVSGAQNGLQEHHSAWYHLKLVHYYLSGVVNSGTSNPTCIKDSGGDTGSYTLSVTATNSADPQEITITITDSGSTTNSMIADIDCSFYQGIKDIY